MDLAVQRLNEGGLQRKLDSIVEEIPQHNNDPSNISHHNKICLIDVTIALYQRASKASPLLNLSIVPLLGLLMDSERHVRSRMVEALQVIGSGDHFNNIGDVEKNLYDMVYRMVCSGDTDMVLTAIDVVGTLRVSKEYLLKVRNLVLGVIMPVFGKVMSLQIDSNCITNIPVPVDVPSFLLLQRYYFH